MHKASKPILFVLFLVLLTSGCVSKNTYLQKVNEADLLGRDVATLQSDKVSLNEEIDGLEKQLTDINQRLIEALNQNSELQRKLIGSRADQNRQAQSFTHQQSEMEEQLAGLQQTNEQLLLSIDQLQREKRQLEQELERERIAREARLAKLKNTYDQLVGALENEIERGELTITNLEGKLSVNLLSQILFDSGKTEVRAEGKKLLTSLGDVISKSPDRALSIEGHTDNVQISSRLRERFPTNWELSTSRATSIVHFLQDEVGITGDRLSATGFGEYRPVADNETVEGRAQNRRIQINLVPYEPPAFEAEQTNQ
ncbi:MAG: OmpA family protein [Desulfuromonadales bacterium]|jgi:chemotaxis protein MotB|nr:OmpA family protein [Desulfuromonadales bacterium]